MARDYHTEISMLPGTTRCKFDFMIGFVVGFYTKAQSVDGHSDTVREIARSFRGTAQMLMCEEHAESFVRDLARELRSDSPPFEEQGPDVATVVRVLGELREKMNEAIDANLEALSRTSKGGVS